MCDIHAYPTSVENRASRSSINIEDEALLDQLLDLGLEAKCSNKESVDVLDLVSFIGLRNSAQFKH